jgi:hypothetical protein
MDVASLSNALPQTIYPTSIDIDQKMLPKGRLHQ